MHGAQAATAALRRTRMPWAWSVFSLRMVSSALVYLVAAKMSSNFFLSTAPSASGLRRRRVFSVLAARARRG